MLTLNDTALYDNQVIWVIKLTTNTSTYYFGSETIVLTNTYDGSVILKDSLEDIEKSIDISNGGGIGEIGSLRFSIARYTNNTGTDAFFNDFYPNDAEYLVPATVDFGIVWDGATTDSEITWLHEFYVHSYSYQFESLDLECFETDELESMELPYYTIQKDYDNNISYWTNAPESNYGKCLPLVYGDFYEAEGVTIQSISTPFMPTICADIENQTYIVGSNKLYLLSNLYKFDDQFDVKMRLFGQAGTTSVSVTNRTYKGSYITLINEAGNIYGNIDLHPRTVTANSDHDSIKEIFDRNTSNYFSIAAGESISCGFNAEDVKASYSDVSNLSSNFKIKVLGQTTISGNLLVELYDLRDDTQKSADYQALTTSPTTYTIYPFSSGSKSWEEILNYEIRLTNSSATSAMLIYEVWIEISEFLLSGIYEAPKEVVKIKFRMFG